MAGRGTVEFGVDLETGVVVVNVTPPFAIEPTSAALDVDLFLYLAAQIQAARLAPKVGGQLVAPPAGGGPAGVKLT